MSFYNKGNIKRHLDKLGLIAFIGLLLSSFTLSSQNIKRPSRANSSLSQRAEHGIQKPLTEISALPDTNEQEKHDHKHFHVSDSLHRADSISMLQKSSLEAPAFTTARDSIIEDFSDGKQMIYYYGDVSVNYGNMKLTADYMEYDLMHRFYHYPYRSC